MGIDADVEGAKAHIGVESKEGIVHSEWTSTASVPDVPMLPDPRHGDEKKAWGDTGCQGRSGLKKDPQRLPEAFAPVNLDQHRNGWFAGGVVSMEAEIGPHRLKQRCSARASMRKFQQFRLSLRQNPMASQSRHNKTGCAEAPW